MNFSNAGGQKKVHLEFLDKHKVLPHLYPLQRLYAKKGLDFRAKRTIINGSLKCHFQEKKMDFAKDFRQNIWKKS